MNLDEAKRLIRLIAKGSGFIRTTRHCRERMGERGVSQVDLQQALLWGELSELRQDQDHWNWKCTICGDDLDGESLTIQVALWPEESAVVCITVY